MKEEFLIILVINFCLFKNIYIEQRALFMLPGVFALIHIIKIACFR